MRLSTVTTALTVLALGGVTVACAQTVSPQLLLSQGGTLPPVSIALLLHLCCTKRRQGPTTPPRSPYCTEGALSGFRNCCNQRENKNACRTPPDRVSVPVTPTALYF